MFHTLNPVPNPLGLLIMNLQQKKSLEEQFQTKQKTPREKKMKLRTEN